LIDWYLTENEHERGGMRILKFAGIFTVGILLALGLTAYVLLPGAVPIEKINSSVVNTPNLIERAWRLPVAATFGQHVAGQSNLSKCGPSSLANVFRSLGERPATEDAVLAGTGMCWSGYCIPGLTLDELSSVAAAHTSRKITVLRDLAPEQFLDHIRRSNDPSRRYVVNFRRREIFDAGGGHFSPIAGYLEDLDLVFVLDVNDHFQPWLVERSRLYSAVNTLDGNRKRGLLLIE
jgi:hypothetical protein